MTSSVDVTALPDEFLRHFVRYALPNGFVEIRHYCLLDAGSEGHKNRRRATDSTTTPGPPLPRNRCERRLTYPRDKANLRTWKKV